MSRGEQSSSDVRRVTVRVVPRASKSEVIASTDGMLRVRIAAPPVEGAANAELIRVLAKHFGVARGALRIVVGSKSKTKLIEIAPV